MTEAELIESWALFLANSQSAMTLYLSILSGYLVIAYLVGNKLSRMQAGLISTLFFFATGYCTAILTTWWQRALEFANEASAINPERVVSNFQGFVYVTGGLFSLGILACLYFMWDVRHPKNK